MPQDVALAVVLHPCALVVVIKVHLAHRNLAPSGDPGVLGGRDLLGLVASL